MSPEDRQALQHLQEQLAWTENTLAAFTQELDGLHDRLARLEAQMEVLRTLLQTSEPDPGPADERPPHY